MLLLIAIKLVTPVTPQRAMELLALMFTDITNEKLCRVWTYVNKVQSSCLKRVSTLRYIEDVLHKCAYAGDI